MKLLLVLLLASPARAWTLFSPWALVWSDEFDGRKGTTPDPAKWRHDVGGDGWGNRELEFYCAPSSPAPCDPAKPSAAMDGKGHLAVTALKNSSGTWTSARLTTLGLFEFEHGRVEARMRLPAGAGLWPAFWMLGVSTAGWPSEGEIDVMENVPANVPGGLGADMIKATIHGPGYSGADGVGKPYKFPKPGRVDDGFHVYGAIRSPGRVQFYVDDWTKPFLTLTPADVPKGAPWVYEKPFYLLMNLAVGGSWPKDPDATTPDPAVMLVDYVRVYRAKP